jgi:hypothetical protein
VFETNLGCTGRSCLKKKKRWKEGRDGRRDEKERERERRKEGRREGGKKEGRKNKTILVSFLWFCNVYLNLLTLSNFSLFRRRLIF